MLSRLTSLQLQGYKTFAGHAQFEFPANITAIVGPNGSGKSNIADSLRWVFGEQSFSLLRARKTEDMIFAGSESKARASMCAATITLNNEDGWLPIDFIEVSITRRAYRDGQNEYLINDQKVRLRDINELLGKSGLAERTYTIIGQGLVDEALSLKPDERRRFFEEAAGIGLYRSRREETLNRLDTTRRNLERVLDILSELEPRLHSLEKQAKRAQEYARIQADLRLLMREWYGYHWHDKQGELAHIRDVLISQEQRLATARNHQDEIEKVITSLRVELAQLRENLNNQHQTAAAYHQERERINRELAVLQERERAFGEKDQALQSENLRIESERGALEERLKILQVEITQLTSDRQEALQSQQEIVDKLDARNADRKKLENQVRALRQEITRLETSSIQAAARQVEIKERKVQLEESNRKHQQSVTQLSGKDAELSTGVSASEKELKQFRQDVEQYRQAESKSRTQIDELNRKRRKLQDDQNTLEGKKARLSAQIDVLEQAEKSLAGVNQGTRQFLDLVKANKVKGSYIPLAKSLEVEPGYERAIAAALGEIFDGLLISEADANQEFLAQLDTQEIGRVVFLVPGSQNGTEGPHLVDQQILGSAMDFIHPDAQVLPVLKAILGNIYLVENRQVAQKLLGMMKPGYRMVTRAGEVFTPEGLIIAGKDNREKAIARPREKREYRETLTQIGQEITVIHQQLVEVDSQIENQRVDLANNERLSREANRSQEAASKKLQTASLELERVQQQKQWGAEQIAQNIAQVKKLDEEMVRLSNDLGVLKQSIESRAGSVTEFNRELNGLPIEDLEREQIHWRTSIAVIDRALNEKQTRLTELKTDIEHARSNLKNLAERSSNYQAQREQVDQAKHGFTLEEGKYNALINQMQELIKPLELELKEKEDANAKAQLNMTVAQQSTGAAERYVAQSQLELARQREGMDSLRRRIEDDFGLVEFQYADDVTGQTPLPLGEMVQQLPVVKQISPEIEESINRQRSQLRRMGAINPEAQAEYLAVSERYQFMTTQVEDLKQADIDLRKIIAELDELMKREFRKTFDAVAAEFKDLFTRLFGGGAARLVLTNEENPTETGIDIEARLPGRREQGLSLLSGGERSLTAVALIFSLLKVSPTPFCVLDEVDAMLDESNVGRFCDLLVELGDITQFIVITHNRNTVQTAGVIYGITMGNDSASQVISLKLDEVTEDMVA